MNWTKEEAKICREIAKHWRKQLYYGDAWCDGFHSGYFSRTSVPTLSSWPLLTIEDCLVELERRTRWLELGWAKDDDGTWELNVGAHAWGREVSFYADTPRLVCLKAFLEVLKEEQ